MKKLVVQEQATSFTVKVNCSHDDNFAAIWKKILDEVLVEDDRNEAEIGFVPKKRTDDYAAGELLPKNPSPNDIRKTLVRMGSSVMILDEFDRIKGEHWALFADTIKMLSGTTPTFSVNTPLCKQFTSCGGASRSKMYTTAYERQWTTPSRVSGTRTSRQRLVLERTPCLNRCSWHARWPMWTH